MAWHAKVAQHDRVQDVGEPLCISSGSHGHRVGESTCRNFTAQQRRGYDVHASSQDLAQFLGDAGKPKQLVPSAWHEIDQEVDVALGCCVTARH